MVMTKTYYNPNQEHQFDKMNVLATIDNRLKGITKKYVEIVEKQNILKK